MASGYGIGGGKSGCYISALSEYSHLHGTIDLEAIPRLTLLTGVSRCYPFWQEYLACFVINKDDPEARAKGPCLPRLEDYYECLHHKKEV